MAALQKVRNWSKFLVVVLALALFAFIAEELVRSLSYTQAEKHQRVGSVYGESISITEFNQMVDELTDVIKFTNGLTNLTDEQATQLRDQVWQNYVQEKMIEHEAEALGLTVTDQELENIIQSGAHPMLQSSPFRTQEGAFDAAQLNQFKEQYDEAMQNAETPAETKEYYASIMNFWKYIEKNIRKQVLAEKYQSLLAGCILSNPVEAQQNYEARTTTSEVLMAAVPYASITDIDQQVSEKELKAKYEEKKELFRNPQEARHIKYIDVTVKASQADEEALAKEMAEYANALAEGAEPAKVVREANSLIAYSKLPITKNALPRDIAAQIDSMQVGEQKGPYYFDGDNTYNIIRLIDRIQQADSIQIRQIAVAGKDMADAEQRADSILTALQSESFDSVAVHMGQSAEGRWISSAQYEGQPVDEVNRKFLETIHEAATGSLKKIELENQGFVVINIMDRRNPVTKYNVAVVKSTLDFSRETYNRAFNNFSSFVAGKNAADLEAEAQKEGYVLRTQDLSSTEHMVGGVRSTREALRWIFNEDTEVGDVSPLYECGNNDHMMVITLTGIDEEGYLSIDNEQVKNFLQNEVIQDKKAAKAMELLQGATDIKAAKAVQGAVSDTLRGVNFAQPIFVPQVVSTEPAISGAISTMKQGDYKTAVRGNNAAFALQILSQNKDKNEAYDQKKEEEKMQQKNLSSLQRFSNDLYLKAKVKDNRYIFY